MKAHDGPLLPVRQVLNAKERFLKEIKSAIPANMPMIRKLNNLVAYVEKVLVVWIEGQSSHNLPFKTKPNYFQFYER